MSPIRLPERLPEPNLPLPADNRARFLRRSISTAMA